MVIIDSEKCTGCGSCARDCFSRNIIIKDKKAQLVRAECIRCAHCVAICPAHAVELPEYDMADVTALAASSIQADELLSFIKSRRSIRQYKDKPVEQELIRHIIEAGRYTPTASNRQATTFIVIEKEMRAFRALVMENLADLGKAMLASDDTPRLLKGYARRWLSIAEAYENDPTQKDPLFFGVPAVILIAGDNPIDAGLAASNMELLACAHGLGVLYSGFITRGTASEKIKNAVGVPAGKEVLVTLLVGYPDVHYERTAPRKAADIVWS